MIRKMRGGNIIEDVETLRQDINSAYRRYTELHSKKTLRAKPQKMPPIFLQKIAQKIIENPDLRAYYLPHMTHYDRKYILNICNQEYPSENIQLDNEYYDFLRKKSQEFYSEIIENQKKYKHFCYIAEYDQLKKEIFFYNPKKSKGFQKESAYYTFALSLLDYLKINNIKEFVIEKNAIVMKCPKYVLKDIFNVIEHSETTTECIDNTIYRTKNTYLYIALE
jgi:hypothetical protein